MNEELRSEIIRLGYILSNDIEKKILSEEERQFLGLKGMLDLVTFAYERVTLKEQGKEDEVIVW